MKERSYCIYLRDHRRELFLSIPPWAIAGILGASLAILICLVSGRRRTALALSPVIFVLFGLLYIGRILYPSFPPQHLVHFAGERKYHIEGVLYRPPEPMPDRTRLYVRGEKIYLDEGNFSVAGNILLTVKDREDGGRSLVVD